jgi:hypothetical protein
VSEEEQNFSEIISASEEEIVSLGSVAGTSVTPASTAIYNDTDLQTESGGSEQSDSMRDVEDENCCVSGKTDWIQNGRKRDRFSENMMSISRGSCKTRGIH